MSWALLLYCLGPGAGRYYSRGHGVSMPYTHQRPHGPHTRASVIGHSIEGGRQMADARLGAEMAIGRFLKRGGRYRILTRGQIAIAPKSRSCNLHDAQCGWSAAHSLWVADVNIGRFLKRGDRCRKRPSGHTVDKIAHPPTAAPSNAGGQWLTHGGGRYGGRPILKNRAGDAK